MILTAVINTSVDFFRGITRFKAEGRILAELRYYYRYLVYLGYSGVASDFLLEIGDLMSDFKSLQFPVSHAQY
ncbi:MAG: hypothetical protein P8Y14_09300, partial [Anaerolineales bacterium]